MAVAAARRVGIVGRPFTLALAGGVIRHGSGILVEAGIRAVQERAPEARVVRPTFEPAVGALLLAFDRAAIEVTDAVEARLRATMPPSPLWDTR